MLGSGWGCCATTERLRVLLWRMMRFWYSASVVAHAMLKHMPHNYIATIVFHKCFRAGC